jgi:hypothetical protein
MRYLIWIGLAVFPLLACGPKSIPSQSPLDSAENHYERGLRLLERSDTFGAQREFERARSLDDDFPGTYVGMALVAMEHTDFWRARKDVGQALHKESRFADAYLALGRIAVAEGMDRGEKAGSWLKEAMTAFERARKIEPENTEVFLRQGQAHLAALDMQGARHAFLQILELNRGPHVDAAMREVERIQMIERASPGTRMGLKISTARALTRAELAVLLLEELKLETLVQRRRAAMGSPRFEPPGSVGTTLPVGTDLASSWAEPWVTEVLVLAIPGLELYPDGTFQPDRAISRSSYAMVNQGILILVTGVDELSTRYVGEISRFPDVRSDNYAYNAITLSTSRGIMSADKISGHFRPNDTVSGAEAILIIRELQNVLRMEF